MSCIIKINLLLLLLLLLKIKCDNPFNDKYLYHHHSLSNYIPLESPFLNSSTIVFEQIIFGNDRKLLAIHMITIIITVAVRDIRGLNGCTMAKYLLKTTKKKQEKIKKNYNILVTEYILIRNKQNTE
ncbi:hypothetical protein DERP_001586 [Dermatophagoides pteronyssinus]|uniref:Uncharacterized protein n=1 Tax=Dermatophagoides pteronyssinus TaxID=6956 RepID=A0ABQ8JBI9_DERPT|nr:hypothetical protein DERP_001586 [Dermatophagoides pteronyssinus]